MSAMGACFISAAGYPSAWMYDISLSLEGAFECGGVVVAASEVEEVVDVGVGARQFLDRFVEP